MATSPARIDFDLSEFNRTLKQYRDASGKEMSQIVAEKSFQMAGGFGNGALQLTKHADANKIARELAQSVTDVEKVSAKTGKVSVKRKLNFGIGDKSTMAARIVNWRRRRDGQPPLWGKKLTDAARKLTQSRIRSVNFIRSGWIASIRRLAPLIKKSPRAGGVKASNPKGYTLVDNRVNHPAVTIVNTALNSMARGNPNHSPERMKAICEDGLRKAVQAVSADMAAYTERKLQKVADKHNAK
jgi:hypothetical protein